MLTITMCVCSCMCVSMNIKEKIWHADMSFYYSVCVCVCVSFGCVLILTTKKGRLVSLVTLKLRRHRMTVSYPWRQGGTRQSRGAFRGWRGFKPFSVYCTTTHITIRHLIVWYQLRSFKFKQYLWSRYAFECRLLYYLLMFKYLCIEFPLQAYCGGWEIKTAWPTHMAASPLYSGVLAIWICLSVTMRGYGNKDLFTGPILE